MPGFKLDKVLHGHEIQVPRAIKNFETKVFLHPRFRAKRFKTEIIMFPMINNGDCNLSDLKYFVSYAYFMKGLIKGDLILDQAYFIQGEAKRKYHQTMKLEPSPTMNKKSIDQNQHELPSLSINGTY